MSVTPDDPILGPARGSDLDAIAFVDANGPVDWRVLVNTLNYMDEVFRLAPLVGIDPAIVVAQSAHETGNWTSAAWQTRLNPAGIGITDGPDHGYSWANGADAARAQIGHLLVYCGQWQWLGDNGEAEERLGIAQPFSVYDPRFFAVTNAGLAGTVRTLRDLTGLWATDPDYHDKIAAKANLIFPGIPDQQGGAPTVPTKPYVLIVAGHRAHTDGGNPAEKALTPALAADYTTAFRAAGYRCDWWQRDLDRDSDPDDTAGGLDAVALGCGRHLATIAGPKVMLDLHFNGAHSPVHVIVPDTRGLVTAYAGGAPGDDTYPVNVLDRKLAAMLARDLATLGFSLYHGQAAEPGVMIEPETGVGRQGFRLAMFAATAGVRSDAVRLVIEHGGTEDAPVRRQNFTQACASLAVASVASVYGGANEPAKYAKRTPIAGPIQPRYVDGRLYLPARSSRWRAHREAKRLQGPDLDGPIVGKPVPAGDGITANYITTSDEGELFLVHRSGTHMLAEAFVRGVA